MIELTLVAKSIPKTGIGQQEGLPPPLKRILPQNSNLLGPLLLTLVVRRLMPLMKEKILHHLLLLNRAL